VADRARIPILEIILLLMLALAVFSPVIARLFQSAAVEWTPRPRHTEANVKVWVNLHSGVYFCRDSRLYGKQKPGKLMEQPDAVQQGYSPAGQKPCQ